MKWGRAAKWLLQVSVPAAVSVVAYRDRAVLVEAVRLIGRAQLAWLLPGVLAIAGVSFSRGVVYGFPLRLLGYSLPRGFLFRVAWMSSSLHQIVPMGGATGYAFLTYALSQRGVAAGEASVIALVDTLSYAVAVATLVVASLAYMMTAGVVTARALLPALAPGF